MVGLTTTLPLTASVPPGRKLPVITTDVAPCVVQASVTGLLEAVEYTGSEVKDRIRRVPQIIRPPHAALNAMTFARSARRLWHVMDACNTHA